MKNHPEEIIFAINDRVGAPVGFSFRIQHRLKRNGQECSVGKSAACQVTKKPDGWFWFCHRCESKGFIYDGGRSPTEIARAVDRLKEPVTQTIRNIELPSDFISMTAKTGKSPDGRIPWDAIHWVWGNNLDEDNIRKYNIGWSCRYQRVIFPVYGTNLLHASAVSLRVLNRQFLLGWVGREVKYKTKDTRPKDVPKYLTKRADGIRWLHYHVPAADIRCERAVLVEDCVSAIRVHEATNYHTIAMLTANIPSRMLIKLKDMVVYVWLDDDAQGTSLKRVSSLRSLGLDARFVNTKQDPKLLADLKIRQTLRGKGVK